MPDAGRVITGSAGGLRLEAPGEGTRPHRDKVKQSLFAMLEAERDDAWGGTPLDLFAGTGAAGIEALSRGAPAAVLRGAGRPAGRVISRQPAAHATSPAGPRRARGRACASWPAAAEAPEAPFGVVVLDPPYAQVAELLAAARAAGDARVGWLAPGRGRRRQALLEGPARRTACRRARARARPALRRDRAERVSSEPLSSTRRRLDDDSPSIPARSTPSPRATSM